MKFLFSILTILLLSVSQTATADTEITALVRHQIWRTENPDIPLLYKEKNSGGADLLGRVEVRETGKNHLLLLNTYLTYSGSNQNTLFENPLTQTGIERSPGLTHTVRNDPSSKSEVIVDQAYYRGYFGNSDITVGRQAINLATTFYFTPNDFFAPFAADEFYRIYKPGVDAIRLNLGFGQFGRAEFIAVAGYETDVTTGRYRPAIDWGGSKKIARISELFGDFDISVIAGKLGEETIVGGSLAGDLPFGGLGIRMEGHRRQKSDGGESSDKIVIELNRKIKSNLLLTAEYFYNGDGAGEVAGYDISTNRTGFLANRYFAFGGEYQLTSLLSLSALYLQNLVDRSSIVSIQFLYSLGNESEILFFATVPGGDASVSAGGGSELGVRPMLATTEIRLYF